MQSKTRFICPLVTVRDVDASRKFYENALDQKVTDDFGENVVFEGGFSIHQRDHYAKLIGNRRIAPGGNCYELYFENDNLDEILKRLEEAEVTFIHKIVTHPWQQRAVRFYDPDMNIIEVGESMETVCIRLESEGKSPREIVELTSLGMEFVDRVLDR
ncbi:MAG: VOC family protein [Chitinispirillaceae bacterium]